MYLTDVLLASGHVASQVVSVSADIHLPAADIIIQPPVLLQLGHGQQVIYDL